MKRLPVLGISIAVLLLVGCRHAAPGEQYGLRVINSPGEYRAILAANPEHRLVEVREIDLTIRFDVRYATTNNFMKRPLYWSPKVFLREPVARALGAAQRELSSKGLGLLIFDGYRPYSVTEAMWAAVGPSDFVADPAKGSRHNRGAAVDLTLISLDSGKELDMPTPYDDFTEKAGHAYDELPPQVRDNRALLREVMERHGFEILPDEWWHYDFRGWREFDLMNLSFEELEAVNENGWRFTGEAVHP